MGPVAAYDSWGANWAKAWQGNNGNNFGTAVVVVPNINKTATAGIFYGTLTIGSTTLTAPSGNWGNAFVVMADTQNGNPLWAVAFPGGSSGGSWWSRIAADPTSSDHVYAYGSWNDSTWPACIG